MRVVVRLLLALVLLVAAAAGAAVWWTRSALPDSDGSLSVTGMPAPVEVGWDSLGVPHLWAPSTEALLFAQGYLHARDRLWQMELTRHVAQGRLAELLGAELVSSDRFLRTLGLWRAAGAAEATLDPTARRWLEAYAAGVNARLRDPRGAWPPELLALRHEPEPWTVRHTLGIEKVMSMTLSAYGLSAEAAAAAAELGPERARHLLPDYPHWGTLIQDAPTAEPVPARAAALLDAVSVASASNAWAVSGERTATGAPILANDPHLNLQAPSIWYLMALHVPPARVAGSAPALERVGARGLDAVGATLPGSPFVVLGHNRAIAWGMTNAYVDDVDLFVERLDPDDPSRYLTPEGSRPLEVAQETIRVKDGEPVVFELKRTRHGPIVSEADPRGLGGAVLAARWTTHEGTRTATAIARLNYATDWAEFTAALEDFDDPHQNVVYADTAGNIGYWMSGTVPLRANGARPPILPVPGWTGEWDWTGTLPFERHPHALNPQEGFVVTANNRQAAGDVGDRVSSYWEEPFRAERIREMLVSAGPLDAAAIHDMQLDVRDALAARYRDRAVAAAQAAGLDAAAARLRDWDLRAAPESGAAALFYTWYERFRAALAADLYEGAGTFFPRPAMAAILEARSVPWHDGDAGPARFEALASRSMREAADGLADRSWSDVNRVVHGHAMGDVRILERVLGLNIGPAPHSGSPTTVNVAHYALTEPADSLPWTTTAGPSLRHVASMAELDGAGGFIIGTGQSGIPFSEHYRDQYPRWHGGGLWRIPLERAAAEARIVKWQTLNTGRQ